MPAVATARAGVLDGVTLAIAVDAALCFAAAQALGSGLRAVTPRPAARGTR
jgi:hypothetical protein